MWLQRFWIPDINDLMDDWGLEMYKVLNMQFHTFVFCVQSLFQVRGFPFVN